MRSRVVILTKVFGIDLLGKETFELRPEGGERETFRYLGKRN